MKNFSLFTASAALAIATGAALTALAGTSTVSSLDNPNGTTTVAAGDTLIVTGNVTSTGDSTSARFNKAGDGTLILKGASNTFKRIKHSAGTLVFNGGATTVSGGTGAGQVGDGGNFFLDGDEAIITGGANVKVGAAGNSGTQYPILRSVSMVITNGTFDISVNTAHALCNFKNGSLPLKTAGQIVTIGEGGLFRAWQMRPFQPGTDASAAAVKDKYGFNIVDGGVLELTGKHPLLIDGQQYGFLHFDGGVLANTASSESVVPCYLNFGSATLATILSTTATRWANARLSIGEGGAVISNAVSQKLYLPVPFRNAVSGGVADGGLHFSGKGTTYLYATGATYIGGTHLESSDGGILALNAEYGDTSLGTVPASPEANIWVKGSNHTLFNQEGDFAIHSNRTVFVKNGKTFYTGANEDARLVIGSLVKGEAVGGLAYSTNTIFRVRDDWSGATVLSPGADRTNDIGRLVVLGALEITNGVTMIASATAGTTVNDALLYVTAGGAAGSGTKGRLLVKEGGVLSTPQTSTRYVTMANYGQADICGGTVDVPNVEWLNALNAPALTTVRDGGFLNVGTFRITQGVTSGNPTVVRLGTNGVMRVNQLALDLSKPQPDVTFLFDGGAIQSTSGYSASDENGSAKASFIRNSSNTKWDGVKFAIGPGGAVFDTSNNKNLFWYRPLVKATGDAPDGGITARGMTNQAMAVCLMTTAVYNGPTIVDGTTFQQRGGDNLIPSGTKLVLKNGGKASFCTYAGSYQTDTTKHTAATLGGIEGDGEVRYCTHVTVNGTIAPSIGGTINFHKTPESLSGTLRIEGDATGCGKVKFDQQQDISTLSLLVPDISTFNSRANKSLYKIVDGSYTGTFSSVSGLNTDWGVRYKADGVYLMHNDAFMLILR